jgi:hypothetical protein
MKAMARAVHGWRSQPFWPHSIAQLQRLRVPRLARATSSAQPVRVQLTRFILRLILPSWVRPGLFTGD